MTINILKFTFNFIFAYNGAMNLCGIIVEYNPFHNGHLYHIDKAKELSHCDGLIAVMSGNYTQRGELSVIDKFKKAEIAINNGVDLVVELPFISTIQSASHFAKGAIDVLKLCQVNSICFGSESDDIEFLKEVASTEIEPDHLKELLKLGHSYPHAVSLLQGSFFPNDILAIAYLKELRNSSIKPLPILRTNEYHSNNLGRIASASAIRSAIATGEDYSIATPIKIEHPMYLKDMYDYLRRLILMSNRSILQSYHLVDEGIEKVLIDNALKCDNFDDFINASISRRYTRARIQRICISILVGLTKKEVLNLDKNPYIRVLAFNDRGRQIIKELQAQDQEVLTQFKQLPKNNRELEYRANLLYASFFEENRAQELIKRELQGPYIKKNC